MRQRIVTAVFFVAVMLAGVFGGYLSFQLLLFLIAAGCAWELGGLLLRHAGIYSRTRGILFTVFSILPALALIRNGPGDQPIYFFVRNGRIADQSVYLIAMFGLIFVIMAFAILVLMLVELFSKRDQVFTYIGYVLVGAFYIGIPICLAHEFATFDGAYHPWCIFGLLLMIWTNDSLAYFVGSRMGKTKLFARISPKKTWEGSIAGAICAMGMAYVFSIYIKDFKSTQWLAIGAVAVVFGTLGDLVESMLKRNLAVKDSGDLLPGHGGMLDRFDAFIFAAPFAWLLVVLLAA